MYAPVLEQERYENTDEHRLWTAVLAQALEEWMSPNRRKSRAAEEFLLNDGEDFEFVCGAAGLNPQSMRAKLGRLRKRGIAAAPVNETRPAAPVNETRPAAPAEANTLAA